MYNKYNTDVTRDNIVKKKLNVLIVDDDDDSRESLRDMILSRGHNVSTLDDGMKCVNRCSETKYDIIFMDYYIGDLDGELTGTDITGMIKECFNIDSDIYAYTGESSSDVVKDFKKHDMKGAFIKPIEPKLINSFFNIIENNKTDDITNSNIAHKELSKLSMKARNFMFFSKKRIQI